MGKMVANLQHADLIALRSLLDMLERVPELIVGARVARSPILELELLLRLLQRGEGNFASATCCAAV